MYILFNLPDDLCEISQIKAIALLSFQANNSTSRENFHSRQKITGEKIETPFENKNLTYLIGREGGGLCFGSIVCRPSLIECVCFIFLSSSAFELFIRGRGSASSIELLVTFVGDWLVGGTRKSWSSGGWTYDV